MRSFPSLYDHDLAVMHAVESLGQPVGFASPPAGALEGVQSRTSPGPDYFVVYPINSPAEGDLDDPYGELKLVYQINVIGRTALGVRHLVGLLEEPLWMLTVPGRRIVQVQPDDREGVYPDRDVTPFVYYATPRFRLWSVPA